MENARKIAIFIVLFLGLMGAIAAPICLGISHSWLPMIGSLLVDCFAYDTFAKYFKELMDDERRG